MFGHDNRTIFLSEIPIIFCYNAGFSIYNKLRYLQTNIYQLINKKQLLIFVTQILITVIKSFFIIPVGNQ